MYMQLRIVVRSQGAIESNFSFIKNKGEIIVKYPNLSGKTIETIEKQNGEMIITFTDGLKIAICQIENDLRIKAK